MAAYRDDEYSQYFTRGKVRSKWNPKSKKKTTCKSTLKFTIDKKNDDFKFSNEHLLDHLISITFQNEINISTPQIDLVQ